MLKTKNIKIGVLSQSNKMRNYNTDILVTYCKTYAIIMFFLLFSVNVLRAQQRDTSKSSSLFRGRVVSTVYQIPTSEIRDINLVGDSLDELDSHEPAEVITFHICNDSLFYQSVMSNGSEMELYQYGNKTLLYDSLYGGYALFPKIKALNEGGNKESWVKFHKKRNNPFSFNFIFTDPSQKNKLSYANIDESLLYPDQLNLGGRFLMIFNPFGRYRFYGGIHKDRLLVQSYTYSPDSNYNCRELFSKAVVIREVDGEIPQNTVYYEPDTVVNFDKDEGYLKLEPLYNEEGFIVNDLSLKQGYTYIELYTDNDNSYHHQLTHFKELFVGEGFKDIDIMSIYLDDSDDISEFLKTVTIRNSYWPHYWAPYGRSAVSSDNLNLTLLPRYIIVDEDWRIIMLNAPRPNDPRLPKVIDQLRK